MSVLLQGVQSNSSNAAEVNSEREALTRSLLDSEMSAEAKARESELPYTMQRGSVSELPYTVQ